MKVPFVDLKAQYKTIKQEMDPVIMGVVEDTAFVGGKRVDEFEADFAAYCDCRYAVGMSSGTSALQIALIAMGIRPGDEVITAANTFIATAEAISHAGGSVKLVDIDPDTYMISVPLLEKAITENTKAIIPVHLYGQPADMDPIREIAGKHGIAILEDAAQAQGARYKGHRAGSMGDAGAFSFYPAKNLGAYGDAGIMVTDKSEIADLARLLINHGRRTSHDHAVVGFNERLDGIQAAVLATKLPHLDAWNQMRRDAASRYDDLLRDLDVVTPTVMPDVEHIYHLYVVRVKDRDGVRSALAEKDVASGIHYPVPIHLLDAYAHLGLDRGSYPVTEQAGEEILSLPMYPEISPEQQEYVAKCLKDIVGTRK